MARSDQRRRRLERLLDIACASRGWSKRRLSQALGRDPTKLIPESGNPKLDFLVSLAELLGTPVGDVVDFIAGPSGDEQLDRLEAEVGFERLDELTLESLKAGRWQEAADLASRAQVVARTPEQFALACNREYGAWDGLGRFQNALEAVRRGLTQGPLPPWQERMLRSNLANAHYTLWNLNEARTIAGELVHELEGRPAEAPTDELTLAFAWYVRGHARRRMLLERGPRLQEVAEAAHADLLRARDAYLELARIDSDESFAGVAHTCAGGLIEVEAALGRLEPREAVERILAELDKVVDPEAIDNADWLESYGWWCVFGSNVALSHLEAEESHRPVAIMTNKAHEIAAKLDNWSLRERAFTLEFLRRQREGEEEWLIDAEDLGVLVGAMGRFPNFRGTGWRILQTAGLVQ